MKFPVPPRIFIGLLEVGGYYTRLSEGFRSLGIRTTFVIRQEHHFGYRYAAPNIWARWFLHVGTIRSRGKELSFLERLVVRLAFEIVKIPLFLSVVFTHDVFIFSFATSFFGYGELPLLRWMGKKIIYIFHGYDGRPPYVDGTLIAEGKEISLEEILNQTRKRKNSVRQIDRNAHSVIEHTGNLLFHDRPVVQWLAVGIPVEPSQTASESRSGEAQRDEVLILHAPSDPAVKGTAHIEQVVAALKAKGHLIQFETLHGVAHEEVQLRLAKCDFVVDQTYSDSPMPGFAAEAALFGKPAVVAGYYVPHLLCDVPAELIPPSHYCLPGELMGAVERLIVDKNFRIELGERARKFVEERWSPKAVAQRLLRIMADDIPLSWMFDPQETEYILGGGVSLDRIRAVVSAIIRQYGVQALLLSTKPKLERKFMDLVKTK